MEIENMVGSKLFEGFEKDDYQTLYSFLQPTIERLEKGQDLILEGETLEFMGIVCSGRLTGIKHDYGGNTHLMQMMEKGDLFGIEIVATNSRVSPITITSVEESTILKFHKNCLSQQGALPPEMQIRVLTNAVRFLANDNIKKIYKMDMLASKSLRGRILTHLYLMHGKAKKSTFSIRMTREQFAQYLCVNRSALSHELGLMKKEGMISFKKDVFTLHFMD
ncbi:MAG: Crp/Fnr family transcriptional regulator [Anaerovorax sp.]